MKTLNKKLKKAFTITELVIVIAVIAILAAVLIPTLSGVISKANQSVALQESKSSWTNYSADILTTSSFTKDTFYVVHYDDGTPDYYFVVEDGQFNTSATKYATGEAWDINGAEVYEELSSTNATIAKIYNTKDSAAAAAAWAAAWAAVSSDVTTLPESNTYYAKVVSSSKTYYFELVTGEEDDDGNVAWESAKAITETVYKTYTSYVDEYTIDENETGYSNDLITSGLAVTAYDATAAAAAAAAAAKTAVTAATDYDAVVDQTEYYVKATNGTYTFWFTATASGTTALTSASAIDEPASTGSDVDTGTYGDWTMTVVAKS